MFDQSKPSPLTKAVYRLANAIATAEGFFLKGSRPQRNHNPGDLTLDIGSNAALAIGRDGPFVVYETDIEGWADLCELCHMMFTGSSKFYKPTMTIRDIAKRYTTTEQEQWAQIVAGRLGVHTTTTLQDLISGGTNYGN